MTGSREQADGPPQALEKRIVVEPGDVTMPGERDAPLRKHVIAAMTFSAVLVAGFLAFVALLLMINAMVGH